VEAKVVDAFNDQAWRLSNLYWITDKNGKKVKFVPNWAQHDLFDNMDYNNVVLKARQLGFTTFIAIYILDTCVFNANTKAGVIAHHKDDAEVILRDKFKFPYKHLPEGIKSAVRSNSDRAQELRLSNDSNIRVSTSMRSGTLQLLHVSEYGKIAAKYPDKAREIRTGAFEAVGKGQTIFVESTAEGREGEFFDLVQRARALEDAGADIGEMDWKFHFYSWFDNPEYRLDHYVLTKEHREYFDALKEKWGIELEPEQKYWYAAKLATQGDDMKREHPSTPDEAFEASVEGAYYGKEIAVMRREGRVMSVPYDPSLPVNTFWDLGMDDATTIIYHQRYGVQNRIIDYDEVSGEGMAHMARILREKEYAYGTHYFPHDLNVRELGTGISRKKVAESLGIMPITVVPRPRNQQELLDQIEGVRNFLRQCYIDEVNCEKLILCLENYRREWDERLGAYKRSPLHNWASHGADGMRTGATGYKDAVYRSAEELVPEWTGDM
jgi:hypothetical protein